MISFRQAKDKDFEFLWSLHRTELKPYVQAIWGWDEAWQFRHFRQHFNPSNQRIIEWEGKDVGTVKVQEQADSIFLAYIAIDGSYQGRGIGTAVIQEIIESAQERGMPLTLRVLRGNPARGLYERLGFEVTEESETHFSMRKD